MTYRRHRLRIDTERHRIEGVVQLPDSGFRSRTTDFFNAHDEEFIAVTDVKLSSLDGNGEPEHHAYLAVSGRHVVLVVELESLGPVKKKPGPTVGVVAPS